MPLRGGAAVPRDRFGVILRHTDAGDIHAPEDDLRPGVARLGAGAEVGEGLCGWAVCILSLCLHTGRTAHREGGDPTRAMHTTWPRMTSTPRHWLTALPRGVGATARWDPLPAGWHTTPASARLPICVKPVPGEAYGVERFLSPPNRGG